jgi:hypothetical protein
MLRHAAALLDSIKADVETTQHAVGDRDAECGDIVVDRQQPTVEFLSVVEQLIDSRDIVVA